MSERGRATGLSVTYDLIARLERAGVEFILGWLAEFEDVRLERFGDAVAAICSERPSLDFVNTVYGLTPADAGRLGAIVALYGEAGVAPRFEVAPASAFSPLGEGLAAHGAHPSGFYAMLFGPAETDEPELPVREVGPAGIDAFARTLLRGHEAPETDVAAAARAYARLDCRRYLVELEGEQVAAGALTISSGLGYLANASTRPEFRRRGCQTALIRRRIRDAAAADCTLVCSQTLLASPSQRNLERRGPPRRLHEDDVAGLEIGVADFRALSRNSGGRPSGAPTSMPGWA